MNREKIDLTSVSVSVLILGKNELEMFNELSSILYKFDSSYC